LQYYFNEQSKSNILHVDVLKTTLYAMLYDEITRKAKYCDKMTRNVMKCINNFFKMSFNNNKFQKMSFKYVADISKHHNVFNSEVKVKHYMQYFRLQC
jgi:hypothetical protein